MLEGSEGGRSQRLRTATPNAYRAGAARLRTIFRRPHRAPFIRSPKAAVTSCNGALTTPRTEGSEAGWVYHSHLYNYYIKRLSRPQWRCVMALALNDTSPAFEAQKSEYRLKFMDRSGTDE